MKGSLVTQTRRLLASSSEGISLGSSLIVQGDAVVHGQGCSGKSRNQAHCVCVAVHIAIRPPNHLACAATCTPLSAVRCKSNLAAPYDCAGQQRNALCMNTAASAWQQGRLGLTCANVDDSVALPAPLHDASAHQRDRGLWQPPPCCYTHHLQALLCSVNGPCSLVCVDAVMSSQLMIPRMPHASAWLTAVREHLPEP